MPERIIHGIVAKDEYGQFVFFAEDTHGLDLQIKDYLDEDEYDHKRVTALEHMLSKGWTTEPAVLFLQPYSYSVQAEIAAEEL